MSIKKEFQDNFDSLKKTAGEITQKVTGPAKKKAELHLGRWIHKNIASLFIWDEHVQGYVFGGVKCPACKKYNRDKHDECQKCGGKLNGSKRFKGIVEYDDPYDEEALEKSNRMKAYLVTKSNNDRKYQKKMKEVNKKLQLKETKLRDKYESMKDSKFVNWLQKDGE